jgi:hypothetical protein
MVSAGRKRMEGLVPIEKFYIILGEQRAGKKTSDVQSLTTKYCNLYEGGLGGGLTGVRISSWGMSKIIFLSPRTLIPNVTILHYDPTDSNYIPDPRTLSHVHITHSSLCKSHYSRKNFPQRKYLLQIMYTVLHFMFTVEADS